MLSYTAPIEALGGVNWLDMVAALYAVYYLVIEQPGIAGPIASAMIAGCWYTANLAKSTYSYDFLFPRCVGLHILCWIAQFYGHGAHEGIFDHTIVVYYNPNLLCLFVGRAPALLDNLPQAIFMAPLFVLMEVLFMFGYRKQFQIDIQKKVDIAIDNFKKSKSH